MTFNDEQKSCVTHLLQYTDKLNYKTTNYNVKTFVWTQQENPFPELPQSMQMSTTMLSMMAFSDNTLPSKSRILDKFADT